MKRKYFAVIVLLFPIFCSCSNRTCPVACNGSVYVMAIGFSKIELDSFVLKVYSPDNTFKNLQDSSVIDSEYIYYPAVNDTLSDTLMMTNIILVSVPNCDLEIYIPRDNTAYKITAITLGGDIFENQQCGAGGGYNYPGYCYGHPYLVSYKLNGTLITVPKTNNLDTSGFIYLHK